jgi:hypothetical protein
MRQTISEWKCFIEPFQAVEDLVSGALTGLSIFQSKDDPEIGFRFQYKMILET